MKAKPLLQAVDFGESVAEYDRYLSSYFIETSSFLDIVSDRADVILGDKGSGKSAIYYHLTNEDADIPQLNCVDIIQASNVQGSVIFRRLSGHSGLPEDAYRYVWLTFIIAEIANHLIYTYRDSVDLASLITLVDKANLRVEGPPKDQTIRIWEKIEAVLRNIASRLEAEGELEFGIPKIPVKARAKGRLVAPEVAHLEEDNEVDLEQVLYLCHKAYADMGRQCWVLFDRLDEAFEQDRDLEKVALRSLLRAHIDLASYKFSMRTKLFLRNDILSRITRDSGFVNATHLRKQGIEWDADSALDLIVRRIASNEQIAELFAINPAHLRDRSAREDACAYILPRTIDGKSLLEWIEVNITDATESLNPRNIIDLLRFARTQQLKVYDRDDPDYVRNNSLITADALKLGRGLLSSARLDDTVLAEFPMLREFSERVKKSIKTTNVLESQLSQLLDCKQDSPEFKETMEALFDAGMVRRGSVRSVVISHLYRPALQVKRHAVVLTKSEQADLREIVDDAVREIIDSTNRGQRIIAFRVSSVDAPERKYIASYVASKYAGRFTIQTVHIGEKGDIKDVIIHFSPSSPPITPS